MNFYFFQDFVLFSSEFFILFGSFSLILFASFRSIKEINLLVPSVGFICFWVTFEIFCLCIYLLFCIPCVNKVVFFGTFYFDSSFLFIKFIIYLFSICVLLGSKESLSRLGIINTFEFYILFHLSLFGMLLVASSSNLLSLYLSLELQSLGLYVLAGIKRGSSFSSEASLKYFVMGAFSSGILLFGCSLIYGFLGSLYYEDFGRLFFTSYVDITIGLIFGIFLVSVGFLFKITAAPWHMWAIDVYEGSPIPITFFFTILPKLTLIFGISKFLYQGFGGYCFYWLSFLAFVGILSLFVGSFGALAQQKIKRFIAFSSVGHLGYILMGFSSGTILGIKSVFIYIIIYIIMLVSMWSILLSGYHFKRKTSIKFFKDFIYIVRINFSLWVSALVVLFSIAGIPPLLGFCGKFFIFFSMMGSGFYFIACLVVFCSVVSCFYYLRLIKVISFDFFKGSFFIISKPAFIFHVSREASFVISWGVYIILFSFFEPAFISFVHQLVLGFLI
uniref:NADH:quinone oxidoreductase/Mrp antiporter transmembrane domain-containing protein n=1 Tax=Mucochytrium quahogii TaxID=96639 RepID=A0A7S2RQT8_9STRA|mmetsp:Transcript_18734/g.40576  ORF Transcript_18734/g.40576 Transcript_18734/m.40576 type:complete len:502 (+) Transcript_18734:146-1651(+)